MLWGIGYGTWIFGAVIFLTVFHYRGLASEVEEEGLLNQKRARVLKEAQEELERTHDRMARKLRELEENQDTASFLRDRIVNDIDKLRAHVHQHLITPDERQKRLEAWMAEAERLNIDLSRIMRDLK